MSKKNDTNGETQAVANTALLAERSVNEWTRKELLALPQRLWSDTTPIYDSVIIVPSGKKHDSGWACIAIIGCREQKPVEMCVGYADDIEWKTPASKPFGTHGYTMGPFRSDMCWKSKGLHLWSRDRKFKVGEALSSTEIQVV